MGNLISMGNIAVDINEIQALTYRDTGDYIWHPSSQYREPIYEYQISLKGKTNPVIITEGQYKKILKKLEEELQAINKQVEELWGGNNDI